jgi:hypothetical protein
MDLIAATGIISIGLVSVFSLVYYGVVKVDGIRSRYIASEIAANQIEIVRGLPFNSLKDQVDGKFLQDPDAPVVLNGGKGTLTIRDWQGKSGLKEVGVRVTWRQKTAQRKVELSTLVTNRKGEGIEGEASR